MSTPLPPFDFDLLRTFVAVVDNAGFTRAGERIGRTQSTVSLQIKKLEEGLGRPLFERLGRERRLTPDGEVLLSYARQLLHLADEARSRILEPEIEGTVRLGTPEDFATAYLPDILARFAATHPDVEVEVLCEPSEDLRERLDRSTIDLSLLTVGCAPEKSEIVWQGPLLWVGSQHHPDVHRRDPLPLALSHAHCSWRRGAERALEEAGRAYRVAYRSNSQTGQLAAVLAGLALTVCTPCTLPSGLCVLGRAEGLPPLPGFAIALAVAPGARQPIADALARHISASFRAEATMEGLALPAAGPPARAA